MSKEVSPWPAISTMVGGGRPPASACRRVRKSSSGEMTTAEVERAATPATPGARAPNQCTSAGFALNWSYAVM